MLRLGGRRPELLLSSRGYATWRILARFPSRAPGERPAARGGYCGVMATDASPATPAPPAESTHEAYPGQRFGLPERGPLSVASMGRRLLALLIDWLLCMMI